MFGHIVNETNRNQQLSFKQIRVSSSKTNMFRMAMANEFVIVGE